MTEVLAGSACVWVNAMALALASSKHRRTSLSPDLGHMGKGPATHGGCRLVSCAVLGLRPYPTDTSPGDGWRDFAAGSRAASNQDCFPVCIPLEGGHGAVSCCAGPNRGGRSRGQKVMSQRLELSQAHGPVYKLLAVIESVEGQHRVSGIVIPPCAIPVSPSHGDLGSGASSQPPLLPVCFCRLVNLVLSQVGQTGSLWLVTKSWTVRSAWEIFPQAQPRCLSECKGHSRPLASELEWQPTTGKTE